MDFLQSLEVTGDLLPGTIFASFLQNIGLNKLAASKGLGPVAI